MGVERMYPPKYWRKRAEEFRTKADNAQLEQTKKTLREVAKNYDDLAELAEKLRTIRDAAE
jgi:hypothetical protein